MPAQKSVHVVVQEGGSSNERYVHAFDTKRQVESFRKSCDKAAYRTTEAIKIPAALADMPGLMDFAQELVQASATFG